MRHGWQLLLMLGLLVPGSVVVAEPPAEPGLERFGDSISVGLATVRVRILDPSGASIPDLTPASVRMRIGRQSVPVVAVDYYDGAVSEADAPDDLLRLPPTEARRHSPHQVSARGQMFVVVVEADHPAPAGVPVEIDPAWKNLVDSLRPDALAAVVALGSGMKLELDLTRNRAALAAALGHARSGGEAPAAVAPGRLALSRHWHPDAGRVARVDRALALVATAVAPLPGEKVLIFLGREGGRLALPPGRAGGPDTLPGLLQDLRTLTAARAALFVLDEPRSLSTPAVAWLRYLASSTGGTYVQARKAVRAAAFDRLAREIRGYYLVTFNVERLEESATSEPLRVELVGRKGTVLASPFRVVRLDR